MNEEKLAAPQIKRRKSLRKLNIIRAKFTDITEDYLFESKPIGSGGFGSVYRAQHQETGQIRAIKHIELKENLAIVETSSNYSTTCLVRYSILKFFYLFIHQIKNFRILCMKKIKERNLGITNLQRNRADD